MKVFLLAAMVMLAGLSSVALAEPEPALGKDAYATQKQILLAQDRAQNFNSTRSNRRNVVGPDSGGGDKGMKGEDKSRRPDRPRDPRARTGRNPQTGKEIQIPPAGSND